VFLLPPAVLLLLVTALGQSAVRQPTPHERATIVAAVKKTWEPFAHSRIYRHPRLDLRPSGLRPRVVSIRVSRSDPRLASAVVELWTPHGRWDRGTAVMVLRKVDDRELASFMPWLPVESPATSFPLACTAATRKAARELLCPDPWSVLDYPRPRARPEPRTALRVGSRDLHAVDWGSVTLPAVVCGATDPIHLRHGTAFVHSASKPWWPAVLVQTGPVSYGDLDGDGRDEAAVGVDCNNGGGMAAGQLGFSSVIFSTRAGRLRVLGVVAPRQPLDLEASHVPLLGRVEILTGKVIAQEAWYGPHDGTCCPSGRAATVWRYTKGTLRPSRTVVVVSPAR
jgi:hypothetical protein